MIIRKNRSHSENEWREILTADEFHILREKCTEPPFSGKFIKNKDKGVYVCADAETSCFLQMKNLTLVVAGLVFGR